MTKLLADTQILLWSMREVNRIPAPVRQELDDDGVQAFFSAISIWEIAIKAKLERADFPIDAEKARAILLRGGWTELAFTSAHGLAAGNLPLIHRDPFDRALIGQALVETLELVTSDAKLGRYDAPVRVV